MDPAEIYNEAAKQSDQIRVEEHIPLVKRIALHMKARLPHQVELEDLEQAGMVGLINAAKNYSASKGASFATYAGTRVKGAMIDELRKLSWAPRSVYEKARSINNAIQAIEGREGRPASEKEIAEYLGMSLEDYHLSVADTAGCQLLFIEDKEQEVEEQTVSDQINPAAVFQDESFKIALTEEIDTLPEKEKLVMALYYQEEMNLKEIGKILELTESRISQIHSQALARLRAKMSAWIAED